VESPEELHKAELITKAIGEKVENLLVIGIKRMILSEVQFVEIRRSSKDRYGIKYPTDITGTINATTNISVGLFPSQPAAGTLNVSGNATSSFSTVFQQNMGNGRLLAQPRLVCASGEKAEFISGGEIPIPLVTSNTFGVEYKPYGIILEIRPTADRYGNIQTEIQAEASEVDLSVAVAAGANASVPGFLTRKVRTNVTVRDGETIVLSGVYSFDEAKAVSKLPGLGHIPIIGELFKNRAFDSTLRELVIFVTPRIVSPESDKSRNLIDGAEQHYRQSERNVKFEVMD
jgi:pilus assembly protein CpaC